MPNNYVETVLLHGAPVAWMQEITAGALTEIFHFNFFQEADLKMLRGGAAASGSNNVDITGADGSILRFPKDSLIIDAITEEEVVEDASTSADASGFGEITLTFSKSPTDVSYAKWTAFVQALETKKDSLWLFAIPIGFTYKGRYQDTTKNVDGYYYLIAKRNSDIEMKVGASPMTLSLTFISFRGADSLAGGDLSAAITGATWTPIDMKIGTSTNITLTPVALVADDATLLKAGKPVLKTVT